MKQSNKDKLERFRPKLKVWVNDQTVHLTGSEKQEILEVIREEFNSAYTVDMWCGICVVRMMEYAFREMDARKVETITVELEPIIYKKKKK